MGRRLPVLAYGLGAVAAVAGLGASFSIGSKSQLRAALRSLDIDGTVDRIQLGQRG